MSSQKAKIDRLTQKGLRSRQHIIDVAMTMIRSQGYAETTIQNICIEVGIGIGTFYHYFRSKEDVLLAYIGIESKALLDFYGQLDKSSYARAILDVANYYIDLYYFKTPQLIAHIYSMLIFSKIYLGDVNEYAFQQILTDAFLQGQQRGEFSADISVDFFCDLVLGEWYYFTTMWCNNPGRYPIKERLPQRIQGILQLVAKNQVQLS